MPRLKAKNQSKRNQSPTRGWRVRLIILLTAAVLLTVLQLLKGSRAVSEAFSTGFSRGYIWLMGHITGILPVSVYEFLLVAGVVAAIWFLVRIIRRLVKKRFAEAGKSGLTVLCAVLCILTLYTSTAGMAYNRGPLTVPQAAQNPQAEAAVRIAEAIVADANALAASFERDGEGYAVMPYSVKTLSEHLRTAYKAADIDGMSPYLCRPKPMMFSEFMSWMHFSGVFMALTGEPNVNVNMPDSDIPYTAAHEMAHSGGFMREGDANLAAMYACLISEDGFVRYSAYTSGAMTQAFSMVGLLAGSEEAVRVREGMSEQLKKDYYNPYWHSYDSPLDRIGEWINNLYLKSNGVEDGTSSYRDPPVIKDSGEVDDKGEVIIEIHLSQTQKLLAALFAEKA